MSSMFLSGRQIKAAVESGELIISPFSDGNLKPASYNFTLDNVLKNPVSGEAISISSDGYKLAPGAFILGRTKESVNLNNKFLCILGTRSSLAQQGIDVLQSSSIAEPDTNGQLTLEITNRSSQPVMLVASERVVKAIFSRVDI
ncbi:MAG: hypothetical protein HY461_00530 [Parcubacteria group bacterium]|nr:hypothetical protein [Parcubacteria group bacterium]